MLALVVLAPASARPRASAASADQAAGIAGPVTFSKDVAPIFQRACQNCHRPGSIAPMSLLTYEDARPWARGIKQKVTSREMPPWFIDRHVGIRKFKDDPSLTEEEIATIAAWVDGGAARATTRTCRRRGGSPMRTSGTSATPDLVISLPEDHVVPAAGPDWWGVYFADSGLNEDRYIQAVETKPGKGARSVVHHAITLHARRPTPAAAAAIGDAERICARQERRFLPGECGPAHEGRHEDPVPDALLARTARRPGIGPSSGSSSIPKGTSRSTFRFHRPSATRRRIWTSLPVKRTFGTMATTA